MKAVWHDEASAESDGTVVVEGTRSFPVTDDHRDDLVERQTHTVGPWKGTANYFTVRVNGQENSDAAWYDPETKSSGRCYPRACGVLARGEGETFVAASTSR